MNTFRQKIKKLKQEHEQLITRPNEPFAKSNGWFRRYKHPILTASHTPLFGVMILMKSRIHI